MLRSVNEIGEAELEAALERLQTSTFFDRSAAHLQLLRFLIATAESTPDLLRETYIATAFYNRDSTYDFRAESLVRVNLRRLRQRLEQYYAGPGLHDPVRITLPAGTYVPLITRGRPASLPRTEVQSPLPGNGSGPGTSPGGDGSKSAAHKHPAVFSMQSPASSAPRGTLQGTLTWAVTLLFFVCGGTFAFVLARSHAGGVPVAVTSRPEDFPLTMGRDLEFEPATSADGKQLAERPHGTRPGHGR